MQAGGLCQDRNNKARDCSMRRGQGEEHKKSRGTANHAPAFMLLLFPFRKRGKKPIVRYSFLSRPKAVCSTRTASSAYFSSTTQEMRISEVLII